MGSTPQLFILQRKPSQITEPNNIILGWGVMFGSPGMGRILPWNTHLFNGLEKDSHNTVVNEHEGFLSVWVYVYAALCSNNILYGHKNKSFFWVVRPYRAIRLKGNLIKTFVDEEDGLLFSSEACCAAETTGQCPVSLPLLRVSYLWQSAWSNAQINRLDDSSVGCRLKQKCQNWTPILSSTDEEIWCQEVAWILRSLNQKTSFCSGS